jgi:hypothetical protein
MQPARGRAHGGNVRRSRERVSGSVVEDAFSGAKTLFTGSMERTGTAPWTFPVSGAQFGNGEMTQGDR